MLPDRLVVSPALVGRAGELRYLQQQLDIACSGSGRCVLVTGEAGIGKSRLLAELRSMAGDQCRVFALHCYEEDSASPYAPLIDALRLYVARLAPAAGFAALGPQTADLLPLLPELSQAVPPDRPTSALDPEAEKRRIVEALARFLAGLAQQRPLLLLAEDVQWSDESTLSFLQFFARRLPAYPVLLGMTYRHGEERAALLKLLAELNRGRAAHELVLRQLSRAETGTLLDSILAVPRPVPPALLDAVYDLTEGNPFFVEETLQALVAAGELVSAGGTLELQPIHRLHIPRSVHGAVQRRVARLGEDSRGVLTLAAVAGRRFGFALLQTATALSEMELVQVCKELVAAQLIIEQPRDQFAFRHALTREAIYSALLRRERAALHRRVAEALERVPEARAADLAYHWFEAEFWGRAYPYAQQAGRQALDLYAPREAIQHLSRALEAARHLPATGPLTPLYFARGRAYDTLGMFKPAHDDYTAALTTTRELGDTRGEWEASIALGLLWAAHDYRRAGEHFEYALSLARKLGDEALIGHSLNRIGNWYANVEQPATGLQHHHEALAMFERLGDTPGVVETLDLLGMTSQLDSRLQQAHSFYRRAIDHARAIDDRQAVSTCLACLTLCAPSYLKNADLPATSLAEAAQAADTAARLAVELGWRAGEAFARLMHAMSLGAQGLFTPALAAGRAALALAEEIEHRQWATAAHAALGMIELDLQALDAARMHLEQALTLAREIGSSVWIGSTASYLATAYLAQGDTERADEILGEVLAHDAPVQSQPQRLCWAARAEVALARGDARTAAQIAERLIAALDAPAEAVVPRLWLLRGMALGRLGRPVEAEPALRAAHEAAVAQAALPWLWRIDISLGKLLQAGDRRNDAAAAYASAREVLDRIAAGIDDPQLRESFLQRASAPLPRPAALSPARAEQHKYGGLTAREREVAVLIVQGLSNRAIADRLFVGVRTVEAHISRILGKLGVSSRAQIAAWAVEQRLASTSDAG